MTGLKDFLPRLAQGMVLTEGEAKQAFEIIMAGEATPSQIGAFLMALRLRGETIEEIAAAACVMRAKALTIQAPEGAVDTCGTGGDASGTYNISTGAALVAAAAGAVVAKHGNRALSSRSGSADVLAALGVNIDADMNVVEACMREINIGFLMAPRHHGAMRHVGPARAELGTRTIFNLLGPLANPAGTRREVLGVFARQWLDPLAKVLGRLGAERVMVVHGADGLDEITTTGVTWIAEWNDGRLSSYELDPKTLGIPRARPDDLRGGDAKDNAEAMRAMLDGRPGPFRDVVVLNAAATLCVADRAASLSEGMEKANAAIDSGAARKTLDRLIAMTTGEDKARP